MMILVLQMWEIEKSFFGVKVFQGVSFDVQCGEIFVICGENGVGKLILMKVFLGVYLYGIYEGEIIYEGEEVMFLLIVDFECVGIVIIYQELVLILYFSVVENIFFGNECCGMGGLIDWDCVNVEVFVLFVQVGFDENLIMFVGQFGVGKQ